MTTQKEILNFISSNEKHELLDYFNKLCEKQKELNQRTDKLTVYFLLAVIVFFLLSFTNGTTVQLGPISISNSSVIYKLVPLLFAYFFLEFAIVTNHRADTMKLVKTIALNIYKQKIDISYFQNSQDINFFTRMIMPFSFWLDLYNNLKESTNIISGCLSAVLLLPILTFFVLPFYFEYVSIEFLIINYWQDLSSKISIITSIWLIVVALYYYVQIMIKNYYMLQKEDRL